MISALSQIKYFELGSGRRYEHCIAGPESDIFLKFALSIGAEELKVGVTALAVLTEPNCVVTIMRRDKEIFQLSYDPLVTAQVHALLQDAVISSWDAPEFMVTINPIEVGASDDVPR